MSSWRLCNCVLYEVVVPTFTRFLAEPQRHRGKLAVSLHDNGSSTLVHLSHDVAHFDTHMSECLIIISFHRDKEAILGVARVQCPTLPSTCHDSLFKLLLDLAILLPRDMARFSIKFFLIVLSVGNLGPRKRFCKPDSWPSCSLGKRFRYQRVQHILARRCDDCLLNTIAFCDECAGNVSVQCITGRPRIFFAARDEGMTVSRGESRDFR